ncbi:MAG TPA: type II secretion system F family protein [Burkholderiales bacterium]|nr:type II secretion system F family protein [Burkholderiales bacterium]
MPLFEYRGRNPRGELVRGSLEGVDTGAIADQLFNTGITPIEIRSSGATVESAARGLLERITEQVTVVDLMLFSRQMYTLLKSGVPILRALVGLQESATNPALARTIQDLRAGLDSGRELSSAMLRHTDVFSPFYTSMVRVGEMTGRLEEIFLRLSQHLDFDREMRQRVKTALRYPLTVMVAMAVAIAIVNLFVIPVFAKVYTGLGAQLPLLTRILIGFSEFTLNYWALILAGGIAGFFAFRMWRSTVRGKYEWDKLKLRIPIAGKIVLKATLARFARSFALAIRSGVPVVQSLSVVSKVVDNDYIAQRIEQMRDGVERGESVLRTAVTTGVFTPVVLQMIAVGDETGELDNLMQEIAEMYEREVEYELKTLSSQIEPIMIVFLAILVLILALGVLLPVWGLGRAVLGPH